MSIAFRLALLLSILIAAALAPRLSHGAGRSMLRVAVLDSGLDLSDSRLSAKLCPNGHRTYTGDMGDSSGHGTHVVGTIERYAGAYASAKALYCIMILKVFGGSGNAYNQVVATAINDAAIDGADIINLSLGGPEYSESEHSAIAAWPKVVFVVAAGNEGKELGAKGYWYYPAAYNLPNIRVVGALSADGSHASYSNYGDLVRHWRLGSIVAEAMGGGYVTMRGTSMATAVETGLLIKSLTQGH